MQTVLVSTLLQPCPARDECGLSYLLIKLFITMFLGEELLCHMYVCAGSECSWEQGWDAITSKCQVGSGGEQGRSWEKAVCVVSLRVTQQDKWAARAVSVRQRRERGSYEPAPAAGETGDPGPALGCSASLSSPTGGIHIVHACICISHLHPEV